MNVNDNGKKQDINIKIVYYGPALSGKTTNLEHIYSKLPPESKGKMVSMKTRTDRTLFFDFLPLKIGKVRGTTIKFLIYTVPGQVYYNATRKLVLNGVDAIVFVADSTEGKIDENLESLENLKKNLSENGLSLSDIPMVIQYNKRDMENCISIEELEEKINESGVEYFEAVAVDGRGVYQTFEAIARTVFSRVKERLNNPDQPEKADEEIAQPEANDKTAPIENSEYYEVVGSEADESESLNSAEERKEEHESVSEFVDQVLTEDNSSGDLEFESSDEDFKEYGHTVDLGEAEATAIEKKKAEMSPEVAVEFINDPLEKLEQKEREADMEESFPVESEDSCPAVTIPLKISREELEENDFRIVLELEID